MLPHEEKLRDAVLEYLKAHQEHYKTYVTPDTPFSPETMLAIDKVLTQDRIEYLIRLVEKVSETKRRMGSSGMQIAVLASSFDALEGEAERLKELTGTVSGHAKK